MEFLVEEITQNKLKIIQKNRSGIFFSGKRSAINRFLYSTRFASKIGIIFHQFNVRDADDLYKKCLKLPWENWIPEGKSIKIESHTGSNLENSRYALYKLKDAIRDKLLQSAGIDLIVEREDPDILILLRSVQDTVLLEFSVTPEALSKRGYREISSDAPLRENLAQAILKVSGWEPGDVLIDPFCGSGTILIEAALLAISSKTLNKKKLEQSYIFMKFFSEKIDPDLKEFKNEPITFFGLDTNSKAIEIAHQNAVIAGVENLIQFQKISLDQMQFDSNFAGKKVFLVSNPPFGKRLGSRESIAELYKKTAQTIREKFPGSVFTVICGDRSLLGYYKLKADFNLPVPIAGMNGSIVRYHING